MPKVWRTTVPHANFDALPRTSPGPPRWCTFDLGFVFGKVANRVVQQITLQSTWFAGEAQSGMHGTRIAGFSRR